MGFSRQEYWSGLPFPSPGDLPNPGIEPEPPALEADAVTSEPPGKPTPTQTQELHSPCFSPRSWTQAAWKTFQRLLVFPFLFFLSEDLFCLPCFPPIRHEGHQNTATDRQRHRGHGKHLLFSGSGCLAHTQGTAFEILHGASQALPQMVDRAR